MSVKKTTTCLLAGLCLSPLAAMAQTAPTAGQILQQENAPPRAPTTEAPRTRNIEVAAGKHKNATAKFNRSIIKMRIKLTCTPK